MSEKDLTQTRSCFGIPFSTENKYAYLLTAECSKPDFNVMEINLPGLKVLNTEEAAMLVVFLDLLMVCFYWVSLMCAKQLAAHTEDYV